MEMGDLRRWEILAIGDLRILETWGDRSFMEMGDLDKWETEMGNLGIWKTWGE